MKSYEFYLINILVIVALVEVSVCDQYHRINDDDKISEDGRLDFTGLAAKYGHPAEEHYVITEDGYNLTLFHLPGDQTRPVLLSHGNTVDADCFIVRGNTSLAITLANKGYDVWVISYRGTIYSKRHVSFDPVKHPGRFFNYTFYEMGIYDVPATIDYILEQTGQQQVLTIGYSMGTTVFYVLGAEKPEYNDKIKALISLAPICFIKNQKGLSNIGSILGPIVGAYLPIIGSSEVGGNNQLATYLLKSFCLNPLSYDVCVKGLVFGAFGPDKNGFEPEFTSTFFGHYPASTSTKLFVHLSQILLQDVFAKYDYGAEVNKQVYNSKKAPQFDLSRVSMKVALLVGEADYLSTLKDVKRLSSLLPNVVHHQVLPYKHFNHVDFVYGRYMTDNLYPYLFELVEKYI